MKIKDIIPFELRLVEVRNTIEHEEYNPLHALEVRDWFIRDGHQLRPIAVYRLDNYGFPLYLVLDGHHRRRAAEMLRLKYLMASLTDYFDPHIKVLSWKDGTEYPKEDIIERVLNGGKLPAKTTKHIIEINGDCLPFQDNDLIEPKIYIPLRELR